MQLVLVAGLVVVARFGRAVALRLKGEELVRNDVAVGFKALDPVKRLRVVPWRRGEAGEAEERGRWTRFS